MFFIEMRLFIYRFIIFKDILSTSLKVVGITKMLFAIFALKLGKALRCLFLH